MVTISMLLPLLHDAKSISIAWNGLCTQIDPHNALDTDAYGNYAVDAIACYNGSYELRIAANPIKNRN